MFSIEKQENDSERFEWNKPFSNIEILFGATNKRLSDIDFKRPTITWLDYDGPLNSAVIGDVRMIAHNACHGSMLTVSVNAHPRKENAQGADMLEQVKGELGAERVPTSATLASLRGWGLADFYRECAMSELSDALSNANAVRSESDRIGFSQIAYFQYEDGARMATFGGVFYKTDRKNELDACSFSNVSFARFDKAAFRIGSPKLTFREITHIERQLPLANGAKLDLGPIPPAEAQEYVNLYRFLPSMFPVEVS